MSTLDSYLESYEKENTGDYEALPAGTYPVLVEEVLMKTPKNGGKDYMNVKFTITGQKYANRKLFHAFNYNHANDKPRQISRGQFASLARCCEAPGTTDLDKVFSDSIEAIKLIKDKILLVKISVKKDTFNNDGSFVNRVEAFYHKTDETGKKNAAQTLEALELRSMTSVPTTTSSIDNIPF